MFQLKKNDVAIIYELATDDNSEQKSFTIVSSESWHIVNWRSFIASSIVWEPAQVLWMFSTD